MKKINAANTEFAKICLKKDGHVNVHAREHVFVNDSRNGNEIRIHAFVVSGGKEVDSHHRQQGSYPPPSRQRRLPLHGGQ